MGIVGERRVGKLRSVRASVLAIATLVLAACVPAPGATPPPPPPPATTVIDPTSGPAGTWISVSPPNDECAANGFASLQATITMYSTGYVVVTGYAWTGGSFSENASPDPMVRLQMPWFAAQDRYLVYLSCYGYDGSKQYAPATFTVTPV